jgi:TrmH family RNA methyltransferase
MKQISSLQNSTIKYINALQKKAVYRYAQEQFVAEGIRTCFTLMEHQELDQLYLTQELYNQHKSRLKPEDCTIVDAQVIKKMSSLDTANGCVGIFHMPIFLHVFMPYSVALINVTDPGNAGTLIRSATAMGMHTIIMVDGVDPYSPKVVQSSAGTIGQVPLIRVTIEEFLEQTKHIETTSLIIAGGSHPEAVNFHNSILLIGNEAHGLPQAISEQTTHKVTLPMPGKTESLNAGVAGSIGLYIMMTQQNKI